jgi:hypothetical protein
MVNGGHPDASAPTLDALMPWSVPGVRPGRAWVTGPDPEALRRRWQRLVVGASEAEKSALLRPSRARTLRSAVPQLPGQRRPMVRLAREDGPCPEPVPLLHGAFDLQWIIPDQRLLDAARPELWRVADARQLFLVEQPRPEEPDGSEPALVGSAALPDAWRARGGPGLVRPLFRGPGGTRPNLLPGLPELLGRRLGSVPGSAPSALETAAYLLVTARHDGTVPLTAEPALWRQAVAIGERLVWLHTRGARLADSAAGRSGKPRMPGGRRPFVRASVPDAGPAGLDYDAQAQALLLGEGRIAPVPPGVPGYRVGGGGVLADWFAARRPEAVGGSDESAGEPPREREPLELAHPPRWGRDSTTELLDLISVLALLDDLEPERSRLCAAVAEGPQLTSLDLHEAGLLPVPPAARRPETVLEVPEEGPDGQFALL